MVHIKSMKVYRPTLSHFLCGSYKSAEKEKTHEFTCVKKNIINLPFYVFGIRF